MRKRFQKRGSAVKSIGWDVPDGWRIAKVNISRMVETHGPCCQNFVATSAGRFPHAVGK